ncbi:hypothetical protein BJP40_06655 [Streptomyces sp. CC53]|uniref:phage portal protein n=1 Tax=Streptomyces sp. CC53 TaxID=1906740 RepID=UPI0008DC860F|nr:phage portal protein [Streptomyces sp. CC53]OII61201.1 hypothetical protein BJP40_06655 [Streptomyces sp. CC53]
MSLLDRVKGIQSQGRKAWSEPPFWSLDRLHFVDANFGNKEVIENDFVGYIQGAFKRNGAVFACMSARQMVFAEARFLWRRFSNGRPGDLFFSQELTLLENPWPGGTTSDLLARMLQDADLAGNAFLTTVDDRGRYGLASEGGPGRRIVRMRPDYVELILGSRSGDLRALDTKVILYRYKPPGQDSTAVDLLPEEVAHFSPIPDPEVRFRGMSWLTPVIREIQADSAATTHKKNFFENAAVPNLAVKFDRETEEDEAEEFIETFNQEHRGALNAYKTLFLMGGADVTPLTADFRQLEFSRTVGKGESRIAAAAGVPPSWVGFSEGMQGSALNAGNFAAARRRYADATIRPLWEMVAPVLQRLLKAPAGASLWYDDRDISFLREDSKDRAEIFRTDVASIASGIMAGFQTDAMVKAARDHDVSELLGQHTGLVSVQMQSTGVPDEEVDKARVAAELMAAQADVIVTLAWPKGPFTEESAIAAVQAGDLSLLVVSDRPHPSAAPPGPPPSDDGDEVEAEDDEEEQEDQRE